MSMNMVILSGNVGQDPEIRTTQNGNKCVTLSIATADRWRDKQTGERKERTEWHRVVIWNENIVRIVEQYVKKGDRVGIVGKLQTRKWQDQDGKDRYSTEVVLQGFDCKLDLQSNKRGRGGDDADDGGADDVGSGTTARAAATKQTAAKPAAKSDLDDEIPF